MWQLRGFMANEIMAVVPVCKVERDWETHQIPAAPNHRRFPIFGM
jgi:hypothetical protein